MVIEIQRKSPPSTVYYAGGKSNFDLWKERKRYIEKVINK